ncbi:MAG TPA: plastocyanin/azurin family copper-binding protein [Gemmatimonadales bacterium]
MRTFVAALALAAIACGGGEQAGQQQPPAAAPGGAPAATPTGGGTGTVHSVDMELRDGRYVYSPATLTIKVGDTVRWINASGGPHNVAFYGDKIPAGAADVLNNVMSNKMSPLSGPLLIDSMAVYQIGFAGAPTGTYEYFCLPHEALGMKATLTIQP